MKDFYRPDIPCHVIIGYRTLFLLPKDVWTMKIYRVLEKYLGEELPVNGRKKMAAAKIKALLTAIDLEAEIIPESNTEMLTRLITSLKGEALTEAEKEIITEITG